MIQSVSGHDYRDPKKITELRREMIEAKLKSHLASRISICDAKLSGKSSRVERKAANIDFMSIEINREKSKIVGDAKLSAQVSCSCSTEEIMNGCQNNRDKRLFKSESTTGGHECKDPDEMATTADVMRNVIRFEFILEIQRNHHHFYHLTIGYFNKTRIKCQRLL